MKRYLLIFLLLSIFTLFLFIPSKAYAASVSWIGGTDSSWTTGANWSGGIQPTSSDDVTIDLTTTVNIPSSTTVQSLTIGDGSNTNQSVLNFSYDAITNGALTITGGNLIVNTGSSITHSAGTTVVIGTIKINVTSGDSTINGSIDTSGKGFQAASGTGAGAGGPNGGGAGYGGSGGGGTTGSGGTTYGSLTAPISLGSGGAYSSSCSGAGGGALQLIVSGTITVTGTIKSNGLYGGNNCGGGSGGSVYITTGTLAGAGSITSNGGSGDLSGIGSGGAGGGGGGRIAILYTTDSSTLTALTAYGITGHTFGGAGTIFKKSAAQTSGTLLIDNNNQFLADDRFTGKTPLGFTQNFDVITIQNDGNLQTTSVTNSTVTTLNWSSKGIITDDGGTFSPLLTNSDVTIPATSFLEADTTKTWNSLTVNGTLTHQANQSTTLYQINLTITGSLTVASGGVINVSGKGFQLRSGPGVGVGEPNGGGAGYGGAGGAGSGGTGGITYGSLTAPVSLGSGGTYGVGGSGGGAVQLTVGGTATLTGNINANGSDGGNNSSGGSGGSVYITTGTLAGAGTITSNGGGGFGGAGGGGGGRISLIATTNNYTGNGTITVTGGVGFVNGSVGTINPTLTPTVVTNTTTDVVGTTATGNANLTATEFYPITQSGHLWSTSLNPPLLNLIGNPVLQFKMDEVSGATVADSSGNGNTGTATGTTIVAGKISNGRSFNGTSSDFIIANTISIPSTISVAAWVNSSNFSAGSMFVVEKAPVNSQWEIFFESGHLNWRGGGTTTLTCNAPSNSQWHYIVGTQTGTTGTLYIDGSQCATGAVEAIANGSGTIQIGRHDAGGYFFNGIIDDVRLYNFVLNSSQVTALYNSGTGTESTTILGYDGITTNGPLTTTGLYTSAIIGLTPNTTYFNAAYVTDSSGATYYGAVDTFTTNGGSPPSSLGPSTVVNGGYINNNSPNFTFNITDTGISGNAKYQIQIDTHSNFSAPIIDYTSAAATQGAMSFTVGQLAGSGTYTTGSSSQTLSDATSYYWRVRAIYVSGPFTSTYTTANSGAVAFIEDTTTPTVPGTPTTSSLPTNTTPTWSWTVSTDSGSGLAATSYSVQWCTDSSFTGCSSNVDTSSTNSYTHSLSLAPDTWYFRVKTTDLVGNVSAYSGNGTDIITLPTPTATPTPTPSNSSSSGSSSSDAQESNTTISSVCFATPPTSAPTLYAAVVNSSDQISLYSTNITDQIDHYVIEYGLSSNNYQYSSLNAGIQGTRIFAISLLNPNTTYYFRIRGNNDCATGPWSNEISAKTLPLIIFNNLSIKDLTSSSSENNNIIPTPTIAPENKTSSIQTTPEISQTGNNLTVTVVNEQKKPLKGVTVTLHSVVQTSITDSTGKVVFIDVESGAHTLSFVEDNYQGDQQIYVNGTQSITVTLKESSMTIATKLMIGAIIILTIISSILGYLYLKSKNKQGYIK